jgi:hypothetical protein
MILCGDLAEADCAIIVESGMAMVELNSATFDFDLNLAFSGIEFSPGMESFEMRMAGEGALAADLSKMAALQPGSAEDMATMFSMFPETFVDLVKSVEGEATLRIELPEDLAMGLPKLTLDLIMTEGVLYADIGAISGAQEPTWMGLDLGAMYGALFDEAFADTTMMDEMFSSSFFTNLYDPGFLNRFVTVTRLDDVEGMGQTLAVFETSYDYGAMFSDEAFMDGFRDYMESFAGAQGESMDMEFDQMMEMVAALLSDISFSTTQSIGMADHYVHSSGFDMVMNIDFGAMVAMMGEMPDEDMPERFEITLNAEVNLSGFNEPVRVTAPEDAEVINPAMFMGAGSS